MSASLPTPVVGDRAGRRERVVIDAGVARFSADNHLVDVDARLTLPVIARLCRAEGYAFPLARPLPAWTLADACARLPFLVDAYVSSVDAVTVDGRPLATGAAPRAATGPDLLGALCTTPPLATCTRARVRVLDLRAARGTSDRYSGRDAAALRVTRLLDEGRAFAVVASRSGDGFVVHAIGGEAAFGDDGKPVPAAAFGDPTAPAIGGARSLAPGDVRAMRDALHDGARVVAAPLMGRAAALLPARATTSEAPGDVSAFVRALQRRGAEEARVRRGAQGAHHG